MGCGLASRPHFLQDCTQENAHDTYGVTIGRMNYNCNVYRPIHAACSLSRAAPCPRNRLFTTLLKDNRQRTFLTLNYFQDRRNAIFFV